MGGGIACCCDVQWMLHMLVVVEVVSAAELVAHVHCNGGGAEYANAIERCWCRGVVIFSLMLMENYKYTLLCNCMQIVLLHSMLRKKTGGMTRRMRGEKRPAKTPEASAKRTDGPIDPPSGVARRQPVRWTPLPTSLERKIIFERNC